MMKVATQNRELPGKKYAGNRLPGQDACHAGFRTILKAALEAMFKPSGGDGRPEFASWHRSRVTDSRANGAGLYLHPPCARWDQIVDLHDGQEILQRRRAKQIRDDGRAGLKLVKGSRLMQTLMSDLLTAARRPRR